MIDLISEKNSKRVFFPKGRQRFFLETVQRETNLLWKSLAQEAGVHTRTLNDWRKEKYSISLDAIQKFTELSGVKIPEDIIVREAYSHTSRAGKIAGKLVYEKYGVVGGNPEHREHQWRKWYEEKGKFNLLPQFQKRPITIPKKDPLLAEFIGAFIGDGGMSERQITLTLNYKDDAEYVVFMVDVVRKLFETEPGLFTRPKYSVSIITLSRTHAITFLRSMGFKPGNKIRNGIDIPDWIMKNRTYKIACMRGLMDTDGCIYNECHTVKAKKYCYMRLSFVSASPTLRLSVFKILQELGFFPKIRNNRSVHLEKPEDIVRYFEVVGSSNPKHEKRFEKFYGGVG